MDYAIVLEWLRASWTKTTWQEIKSTLELILYFLAVFAVLACVLRLGTIRRIIADFVVARGPIWDLRQTINDLKSLEPVIKTLAEQMALLDAKIDAARKQVAELQIENTSSRTQAIGANEDTSQSISQAERTEEDINWEKLRELWYRNAQRLEYTIDQIKDGRRKIAYDRMPRSDYKKIIDKLRSNGMLTAAAATASKRLVDTFNSYRPRNRRVRDEEIGALIVLDQLLDRELVSYETAVADEEKDEANQSSTGAPQSSSTNHPQRSDHPTP
jgi:hypothetical protein